MPHADLVANHSSIEGIIIACNDDEVRPYVQAATMGDLETRRNASLDCLTTGVHRLVQV